MKGDMNQRTIHFGALFVAGTLLAADPPSEGAQKRPVNAEEKLRYHLFNPTPRQLMREMSTDRPDKTESAYTVDAGHFQVEADLVSYAYDAHNPDRDHTITESLGVGTLNI